MVQMKKEVNEVLNDLISKHSTIYNSHALRIINDGKTYDICIFIFDKYNCIIDYEKVISFNEKDFSKVEEFIKQNKKFEIQKERTF